MKLLAIALAILLVGLVPFAGASPAQATHPEIQSSPAKSNPTPFATIQQTSTAIWMTSIIANFWQNTTATYGTGNTPANYSMALGVPYSSIATTAITFTISMPSGLLPRINITQGTRLLANTTAPFSIPIAAQVAATTKVSARVVAAYTTTGAVPPEAHYLAYSNLSRSITFTNNSPAKWIQNQNGQWNLSYLLVAPAQATLNNTVLYFPFPGNVTMNYSSVVATFANRAFSTFQVVTGGIFVNYASLQAGHTARINVTGFPAAAASIPPPLLPIHFYYADVVSPGYFYANVSWFNNGSVPYSGAYVLDGFFPYPISPSNFTLKASGRIVANGSVVISGDRIMILANSWTTAVGAVTGFLIHFAFSGAPPTLSIADNQQLFRVGATTVTWGGFFLGIEIIIVVLAGVRLGPSPKTPKGRSQRYEEGIYFFAAFVAVALFLAAGQIL